jgi:hypothetical protein
MFEGRRWQGEAGAADDELDRLRATMPVALPDSFYQLLSWSNGGEGPLSRHPCYFSLFPVEEILDIFLKDELIRERFPGLIFFGNSAGSSYLAFDTRSAPPFRIVTTELLANLDELIDVAPDFDAFLDLVGYRDPEVWGDDEGSAPA